jgi:CRP-like cAMP-binding protein
MRENILQLRRSDVNPKELLELTLQRANWAAECNPETLQLFMREGVFRQGKRGQIMWRRGEFVKHLALVLHGSLDVSVCSETGKRFLAALVGPGELFNLVGVLSGTPLLYDGVARTDTLICLLHKSIIDQAMMADSGFTATILELMCARARVAFSERADLMLMSLRQRCAKTLLSLVLARGNATPVGTSLPVRFNQTDFADLVGCTRPKANHQLKRLENEGIIRLSYSGLVVMDLDELGKIASGMSVP